MVPRTVNGKVVAHFDEQRHVYTRNGDRYPGVTTICAYAADPQALMYWNMNKAAACAVDDPDWLLMGRDDALRYVAEAGNRERDTAGTRGTAMHDSAEYFLRHGNLPKGLDDEQQALADQCVRFINDFGFEPEHVETPLFNDTHKYAGKPDAIGRCRNRPDLGILLPDWKSGALVVPKFCAQLVAYARAELLLTANGDLVPMPHVDTAAVVQVTVDDYQVHPMAIGDPEWEAFLAALAVYRFNLRCKRKYDTPLGVLLTADTPTLHLVAAGDDF